jgi:drug/metabolite transporter (DMT)-like permease
MSYYRSNLAALMALSLVFGAAFIFMKVLVEHITPGEIVFGRLLFGSLVVLLVAAWRRPKLVWRPLFLLQVSLLATTEMIAPYLLIAWAEIRIPGGIAAVLVSTMPLFTAVIASATFADERLRRSHLAGLALGILGVALASGATSASLAAADAVACLAVVAAALFYACGTVYARVLLREEEALGLTAQQLVFGTVAMLVLTSAAGGPPSFSLTLSGWGALVGLGAISTGVGMLGAFWLVSRAGSVQTSLVTYLIPISGLALGWLFLGEPIEVSAIAGFAFIAAGVTFVLRGSSAKRVVAGQHGPSLPRAQSLSVRREPA